MYRNKNIEKLDNEIWVDAIDFDGMYSVSNLGRVKSERRIINYSNGRSCYMKERIMTQFLAQDGRLTIKFYRDTQRTPFDVSVLVWQSFNNIETPEGKIIIHKNKIKTDNRLCNLEATTISVSHSISYRLGLCPHWELRHLNMVGSKWNEGHGVYVDGILTEILCNKCFNHKPISEFLKARITCKKCVYISRGTIEVGKLEYFKSLKDAGLKRCPKCTEVKTVNDFYKGDSKCKKCKSSYSFEKTKERAGKKLLII